MRTRPDVETLLNETSQNILLTYRNTDSRVNIDYYYIDSKILFQKYVQEAGIMSDYNDIRTADVYRFNHDNKVVRFIIDQIEKEKITAVNPKYAVTSTNRYYDTITATSEENIYFNDYILRISQW